MDLKAIQSALRDAKLDAWLFYDHHHRDPIAYRVLGISESLMVTRRWFYCIPANGEPQKLVHRIEAGHLDPVPGERRAYSSWQELSDGLKSILQPYQRIAMQYSPNNAIPYIGLVDAGTIELIRSFGKEIVSSGARGTRFEATLTDEQVKTHYTARDKIDKITADAFKEIGRRVNNGGTHEFEIQQWIMEAFRREGITPGDDAPIVGANANSGNPHYEPTSSRSAPIRKGDFVLLDIWGKLTQPNSIYYDITWTGVVGTPSDRHREIFKIVTGARDAAIAKVKSAVGAGQRLEGWMVDQAARDHIAKAGYGQYFVHRTGHSDRKSVV